MKISAAINALLPQAEYSGMIDNNTKKEYDAIKWNDKREKPTWKALKAASVEVEAAETTTSTARLVADRIELYKLEDARDRAQKAGDIEAMEEIDRQRADLRDGGS
jgi:hypothetical protein